MNDLYLWVKWAHIVSATILFGTGLGTAFHMYATHLRRNVHGIAVTAKNTILADWIFTALSGIVQPVTGFLMVRSAGYDPFASWLVATYALYVIAGACWLKVVHLQYRMRKYAVSASNRGETLPREYDRTVRLWFLLGWPAFLSLLIVFALMVMKPKLW